MSVYNYQQSLMAGASASKAFTPPIEQSLIFDGAAYLSWTPGGAGNRKTWSWLGWVRRSVFGTDQTLFSAASDASNFHYINFAADNTLICGEVSGGGDIDRVRTNRVFRDIGWLHVAVVFDTTQATASDRVKIYINGGQETSLAEVNYPTLNHDGRINQNVSNQVGRTAGLGTRIFNGAMADIHFLDGTALTEAQINATFLDGVTFDGQTLPAPKAVTGLTYGTNGFHLAFADTSAFGDDTSGNGNDWTPTGFVAGDQSSDVPGRPYAFWNPVTPSPGTITDGGRGLTNGANHTYSSLPIPAQDGTYYAEFTVTAVNGTAHATFFGVCQDPWIKNAVTSGATSWSYEFSNTGNKYTGSTSAGAYGSTALATNTNVGICVKRSGSNTKIWWRLNGTWQNSGNPDANTGEAFSVTNTEPLFLFAFNNLGGGFGTESYSLNTGTAAFVYAAPTGSVPLSANNLPTSEHDGRNYFAVNIRTGTGAAYNVTTGPANGTDLVWAKGRSGATDHAWYDIVRGVQQQLESNTTTAETTEATGLTAFNSTGYTAGALAQMNTSAATYVDWMWKAGGAGVANTDGTISSTVSVAAPGHFAIVEYQANGTTGATVGHGMGGAPELIIIKGRNTTTPYGWFTYSAYVASPTTSRLELQSTSAAVSTTPNPWNSTAPSSTVFTLGSSSFPEVNENTKDYIAYCFRSVPGLCKVGSYTGNGSADGPLIWLGFTARWVLIKSVTQSSSSWYIYDTARQTINPLSEDLLADSTAAEPGSGGGVAIDILGDSIKHRSNRLNLNNSGSTYIYLAMADIAGGGSLPWPLAR